MLRAAPARLLITDMQMPRLSGAETLAIVGRELPSVRVIAMSAQFGSGRGVLPETALALGACRVLAKPFGHRDLLGLVTEILSIA
jgi:CheY-like chemotaxis protein